MNTIRYKRILKAKSWLVAENEKGGELKHPEEFNANVKPVDGRDAFRIDYSSN